MSQSKYSKHDGTILSTGTAHRWGNFQFVPKDNSPAWPFYVFPDNAAFMLRGIIAVSPDVQFEADVLDGHRCFFLSVSPPFAREFYFPGQSSSDCRAYTPPRASVSEREDESTVRPLPSEGVVAMRGPDAKIDHHPKYHFRAARTG